MTHFDIVVAMDLNRGIGKDGAIPWRLPGDLRHFRDLTGGGKTSGKKNAVIMGRKTWESIPERYRPLPERINMVLSRQQDRVFPSEVITSASLEEALNLLEGKMLKTIRDNIFIIGGGQIYARAVSHPFCRRIYATLIEADFQCDTYFPEIHKEFIISEESQSIFESNLYYRFATYKRKLIMSS